MAFIRAALGLLLLTVIAACARPAPSGVPPTAFAASTPPPTASALDVASPHRVASFAYPASDIANDPARGAVWAVATRSVEPDYVYRFDTATRAVKRWTLPATDASGPLVRVVVDRGGAVWVLAGYELTRLDPETGSMTTHAFDLEEPGVDWRNGGTWGSAITAFRDGVLVARNLVPALTYVDATGTPAARVDVAAGLAGSPGLVADETSILILRRDHRLVRLAGDGTFDRELAVAGDRLVRTGNGIELWVPALWPGEGYRLAADGTVIEPVHLGFVPERRTVQLSRCPAVAPTSSASFSEPSCPIVTVGPQILALTRDGAGRTWFAQDSDLYELRTR